MILQHLTESRCKKVRKEGFFTTLVPDLALFGDKKKAYVVIFVRFTGIKQRRRDSEIKKFNQRYKMLFDSHAHINNDTFTEEEREALIADIEASDLSYVMDIGFDLPSSEQAVKDAQRLTWCYAAVGVHPHDAKTMDEDVLRRIKELAGEEKVQAIGEIGLDFYYNKSEAEDQRYWFRRQIQLANELKMPIVIHSREADQETMDILKEEEAFSDERASWFPKRPGAIGAESNETVHQSEQETCKASPNCDAKEAAGEKDCRVLLHCFSGSRELAEQYVKLGATISIAGPVTYKNNRKTTEVVGAIPIEYLLVETDSPYLTPEPFRGRKNKPPYVEHTARRVALIKGMEYEDVCRRTLENAKRFFGIE